jgi:hypothetical protein
MLSAGSLVVWEKQRSDREACNSFLLIHQLMPMVENSCVGGMLVRPCRIPGANFLVGPVPGIREMDKFGIQCATPQSPSAKIQSSGRTGENEKFER